MSKTKLGDVEFTERGFEIIRFNDSYDQGCSLQQSSLAEYEQPGTSAVWLGIGGLHRMHLKPDQVQELIEVLVQWLNTGSFQEAGE